MLSILIDDRKLGGLEKLLIEDYPKEKATRITLHLIALDNLSVLDMMRKKRFEFRLFNDIRAGWLANDCELETFVMETVDNTLKLKVVVLTKLVALTFHTDVSAEALLAQEKQDVVNLISIIKEYKDKDVKKNKAEEAVLPYKHGQTHMERERLKAQKNFDEIKDEELVWANSTNPTEVEAYVKPRKLKKTKKTLEG